MPDVQKAARQKRYVTKVIIETLTAYGGQCVDCGCKDFNVLELDHENGAGNVHRDELFHRGHSSSGGWHFYVKLRKAKFPPGYVVRCVDHHSDRHPRGNPFSGRSRRAL
jgi:hypothetical protein